MSDKEPTIVIMGGNTWAKGATEADAKKEFRRHGGTLGNGYTVFTFDADAEFGGVDQMGYIHWNGNRPTRRDVKAR